ncbi:APL4 [Candida pseudojiufengensis]|uniref:APL4 n=1 Tax=Candida pseudojiufengensis TaxID=497109 RepID=UPI0022247795|nr:APL4 [Candida pseudojiufengensis]KAI5966704.1 APL4 [Candida pseudojiufengensis]
MGSLRSFIKAVRKAKTIADERAVIQKESAAIRTSFRDVSLDHTTRRINISKLLYLYIMGEKTHFGQVECLKLLASPRFADKRLGYLACMLILDENQEVLTLLTNSLDNDMQHPNAYIVGLALCCLGNIASPELARDLYQNVETILDSKNNFLKKKACFVAAKLIEKEPDLSEFFLPKALDLINEKNPSVLLGTLRLIQSLHSIGETSINSTIPKIVNHLKRISTSGYQPDYDVMGTTDPFLQVSLLETLRILGGSSEEINDILTQVASLDSGKNSANAILYECVKTIFTIDSDQSLKILGVNILGKFLSTKDNNTRYVALDTLLSIVNIEPLAVQRHRSTIINCLTDGDISIRRRALELAFGIINEQNIRVITREILTFLETCTDFELKSYVTSQITIAANKYSPNDKWHFDTLIRVLEHGGNALTNDIMSNILALILQCEDQELKKHVVLKLYESSLKDNNQFGLILITSWALGEYGDLILNNEITESSITDLFDNILENSTFSSNEIIQLTIFILTAVLKLSSKFKNPKTIERLRNIISSKTYDSNLEIQTRAVEYQEIFGQDSNLKKGLLSKMPPPPIKQRESLKLHKNNTSNNQTTNNKRIDNNNLGDTQNNLLDLIDIDDLPPTSQDNDVLSDIFGDNSTTTTNKPSSSINEIKAFENSNLKVSFIPKKISSGEAIIETKITSTQTITQIQLLIAVPKTQKLIITSTSGDSLNINRSIIQNLKITGKEGSKLKLRVKIKYKLNNEFIEDQFDFSGFNKTI